MKTHEVCATITPLNIKRKGFSDLTGAFPHKSIRGIVYVMVMYDYNRNIILIEPIKKGRQQPSTINSSTSTKSSKKKVANQKFTLLTTGVLVTSNNL